MSNETTIIALRKELADYSRRAFQRGLVSGAGGNMSLRVPGTDKVLITPTGVSLEEIDPEANLLMAIDGTVIENPCGLKPSKETGFHLSVYQLRPEAGACAHLHPPYTTAYANVWEKCPLPTVSARGIIGDAPRIESAPAGSPELHSYVREGLQRNPAAKVLLMREHGLLAMGPDIKTAYYLADLVEDSVKIAYLESQIRNHCQEAER